MRAPGTIIDRAPRLGFGALAESGASPVMHATGACTRRRPLPGFPSASQEAPMAATRTPGITLGADGRFFIDKRYRGIRIGTRVGPVTQDQAEQRLQTQNAAGRPGGGAPRASAPELRRLRATQSGAVAGHAQPRGHPHPCSVAHPAHRPPRAAPGPRCHAGATISERIADGVCEVTINRTLEVARTILHRAARSYRDENGRPTQAPMSAACCTRSIWC